MVHCGRLIDRAFRHRPGGLESLAKKRRFETARSDNENALTL